LYQNKTIIIFTENQEHFMNIKYFYGVRHGKAQIAG